MSEQVLSDRPAPLILEPGVYPDIKAEAYHSINAVNSSRLKLLQRSPAHLRADLAAGPSETTQALFDGTVIHTRVLEPERYKREVAIKQKVDGRTKEGKDYNARFEVENLGKMIVTTELDATADAIARRLLVDDLTRELIATPGQVELTLIWNDLTTRLLCKARLDKFIPSFDLGTGVGPLPTIVDLKTTEDASPEEFPRSLYKYRYHLQASHYIDGAISCGLGDEMQYVIIAVEKAEPCVSAAYLIDEVTLRAAFQERVRLLDLWSVCAANDVWPGYSSGRCLPLSLPHWALRQESTVRPAEVMEALA